MYVCLSKAVLSLYPREVVHHLSLYMLILALWSGTRRKQRTAGSLSDPRGLISCCSHIYFPAAAFKHLPSTRT
ncbi:hypothetical protein I7I53_09846 [Histoplasma capsulatum var. duboisii H88]|uniref:Uncharacterized protein n=1 Tax=Ajellomyces capsulatus (strain H88) TaxID=544711 RepID=A0A8A1L9X4_AJEC8|nr:hypothetical protein I7I53_09846 [Histoplasma capsulatum var. duboisii H88]